MISLSQYIENEHKIIDGHIHLFDWKTTSIFEVYKPSNDFKQFVGFLGVDFKNIKKYSLENCIEYYERFIDSNSNSNVILLSSGLDSKTVIENFERHKDTMKGFGELLCYDKYDDIELPYKNTKWIEEILEYNTKNLPVFIHYSLTSDKCMNEIDELAKKYSYTPIVLCHCGLPNIHEGDYKSDYDKIFERFIKLQIKHTNIYTDVCDSAFEYISNNMHKILSLNSNRTLIGTDITPGHFNDTPENVKRKINKSLSKFDIFKNHINSNKTIKQLFRL